MVTPSEFESLKSTLKVPNIMEFVVSMPQEGAIDFDSYASKMALYNFIQTSGESWCPIALFGSWHWRWVQNALTSPLAGSFTPATLETKQQHVQLRSIHALAYLAPQ